MILNEKQKALLMKLKQQVRMLERKEVKARNQLRTALKKVHGLAQTYKSKLASKVRVMEKKIAIAIAKAETQHAAKITKHYALKTKKPSKSKKSKRH